MQSSTTTMNKATEASLLRLLTEQREAFLAFVRRRVRSGADAEDLLQTAYMRATEKLGTLRDGERLEAWFYRVLRNTIADHHAAWARREAQVALIARDATELPPNEAAVCACSLGVLDRLTPDHAAILRLVDIEEGSLDEAAHAFHTTTGTAKVRLHRARKALREALHAMCGTDSVKACLSCDCD